jgi:hypothetical protein
MFIEAVTPPTRKWSEVFGSHGLASLRDGGEHLLLRIS